LPFSAALVVASFGIALAIVFFVLRRVYTTVKRHFVLKT
jgi:hypothetical protein